MTSQAHQLFQQITEAPTPSDLLKGMVIGHRTETEYLEFKGATKIADKDVKETWSIALSGFANTGGGVLVWGIRAARVVAAGASGRIDAADSLDLVPEPITFVQHLKDLLLEASADPVQGVEIKAFHADAGAAAGFVVCLIPEGNHKPYRAALDPKRQYYQRVGDSFTIISHSLLRSLFFPRTAPNLRLFLVPQLTSIDTSASVLDRRGRYPFIGQLSNHGTATASDVYVVVGTNIPQSKMTGTPPWFQFVAETTRPLHGDVRGLRPIHPGEEYVTCFSCALDGPAYWNLVEPKFSEIEFQVRIFAANAEPTKARIVFSLDEIMNQVVKSS